MILKTLYQFLYQLFDAGNSASTSLFVVLIGGVSLSLIALVMRLISRVKSFALFGG